MKLGAYGCLRVAMTLFPLGLAPWASPHLGLHSWRDVFALLAVIGIVYGALVALVQRDFKFVIGYSSVSHMGFILLGLMTLNLTGLSGAVLQMISHGLLAGLLFAVVGRMVYARTHTRELALLGPMNLNRTLPFAAVTFVIAAVAAMGLPGFSGFVAELMIVIGAWRAYPLLACAVGLGILIGVVYVWRAMQKAFFSGSSTEDAGSPTSPATTLDAHLTPITLPEKIAAILLIACSVLVGLFPHILLNIIQPALNSPPFESLRRGGNWQ
jgi:NADH-quinone oxidoreductase subunit M